MGAFLFSPAGEMTDGGGGGAGGTATQSAGADGGGGDSATAGSGTAQSAASASAGDSWFRSIFSEDGKFADNWQDKLPGDMTPYKATLANFKDFNGLSKALVDNMQAARTKHEGFVRLPGKDASAEEKMAFYKALGVPEKPEDYGLSSGDAESNLPEGMYWDDEFATSFSKTAHSLGLTPSQVQGLTGWHRDHLLSQQHVAETEGQRIYEQQMDELRYAFGDRLEKRLVDARRVAMTLGLDPDQHPIMYRADTVRALTKVADLISEDKMVGIDQVTDKMTPLTQAKDIQTNTGNPDYQAFHDAGHPRHDEVAAKVNDLYRKAYPG